MQAEAPEPALVTPPSLVWRVERISPPLRFARMAVQDAALETGNRFDVVGVGVLYAATDPAGAFAETLASYRLSSSLLAKMAEHEPEPGSIAERLSVLDVSNLDVATVRGPSRLLTRMIAAWAPGLAEIESALGLKIR